MLKAGIIDTLVSVIMTGGASTLLELAKYSELTHTLDGTSGKFKFQLGDTRAAILETTAIASLVDRLNAVGREAHYLTELKTLSELAKDRKCHLTTEALLSLTSYKVKDEGRCKVST